MAHRNGSACLFPLLRMLATISADGLPHVPGSLRVALLIDHRLQETPASTFRFRVIIKSQQPVARGASIVAIEVWCHESAVRLLEKEAGSGTLFALK